MSRSVTSRWTMPDKMLTLKDLWHMELAQLKLEREQSDPDPDLWRWSPLEITEFARMLEVARGLAAAGLRKLRIAEAGCGIGTKLYLMKNQFELDETGYEINDLYLAMCKELGVHAVKCDLRVDKPPWEKFDIVYLSRPFKSDEYEVEWEWEVINAMRPGAVLISAYAAVKPHKWQCYYRKPFRGVWVKPHAGTYDQMISRTVTGSDPLVPEPSSRLH
jgi:SAM-dependent methyltransferase